MYEHCYRFFASYRFLEWKLYIANRGSWNTKRIAAGLVQSPIWIQWARKGNHSSVHWEEASWEIPYKFWFAERKIIHKWWNFQLAMFDYWRIFRTIKISARRAGIHMWLISEQPNSKQRCLGDQLEQNTCFFPSYLVSGQRSLARLLGVTRIAQWSPMAFKHVDPKNAWFRREHPLYLPVFKHG